MAPAHARIPNRSTAIYNGCSWLLKALYKIVGPIRVSGNAPAKYLIPLPSKVLLVCFILNFF